MLSAANDAWRSQGRRVFGASLSGKAADGLQASSNIESRTLASWQLSWENGYNELQPNDVFVIDEAGMVGNKQLLNFIKTVINQGAKLVLVGDPEQLQPIQAGNPLRDISRIHQHVKLTEILRQKEDWQRQASFDLASGNIAKAIDVYNQNGALTNLNTTDAALAKLTSDYINHIDDYQESKSRIALAFKRRDVHTINQLIRSALLSKGKLTDEMRFKTEHGPRAFAVGDKIVFTKNNKELEVKNGSIGTVKEAEKNTLKVTLKNKTKAINVDLKCYSSIDHGYATTIHKSQGITVADSFIFKTKDMDKHLSYVAMTRHNKSMRLYQAVMKPESKIEHAPSQQKSLDIYNEIYQRKLTIN